MSPLSPFGSGLRAFLPLIPGVLPFGMVVGIAAVQAGFTPFQAVAFSLIGYAGSAQLVAAQLYDGGAPLLLILVSSLIINLRFAVYSASLLEVFAGLSLLRRWPLAYLLTDQAYALTALRPASEARPAAYYAGAASLMWLTWQLATLIGAVVGARLPADWPLDFAVPLSFIALILPALKTRPQVVTALVSGVVAVMLHALPFRLNLMIGAAAGIATGLYLQRHHGGRS